MRQQAPDAQAPMRERATAAPFGRTIPPRGAFGRGSLPPHIDPRGLSLRLDKLGVPIAVLAGTSILLLPFATLRANRIVAGAPNSLMQSLPFGAGLALLALLALVTVLALFRLPPAARLGLAVAALAAIVAAIGLAPLHLAPPGNTYARVSPAAGFWLALFAYGVMATDALTRLRPRPLVRLALLAAVVAAIAAALASGVWDGLSVLKEYGVRSDSFWREAERHVVLAVGSLAIAVVLGIPFGILCYRVAALRTPVLNILNIVQTIPSIALFGILIAPLGWVALHVPGANALGVRGIGAAPALTALVLYSLLPVVANTLAGLQGVPAAARDAASGIGMTRGQRLVQVEFPLAFPVILTGIRIVLVQNVGLATIAALIGGGGFGVFVFQGIGQNATDLVLLGAMPTVFLAFLSAILLDAAVELASTASRGRAA